MINRVLKDKRAQGSIEYVIILALVLVLTIPLLLIFYDRAAETQSSITFDQAQQIGKKVVDNAENVYYLGENAKRTLKIYMPKNIVNITILNNEVVFRVTDEGRISEIATYSVVNLTGNLSSHAGTHTVIIESLGNVVEVGED